ncbi:hypothetical protein, partial [Nocardiopsis nanhaiensis]
MLDTCTGDLLTAVEDALRAPAHLTPHQLCEWHAHTLRNRLPLIRDALRIARTEDDAELATHLIDQAVADHPTCPVPPPREGGAAEGDGARLRLPAHKSATCESELSIPEHVLCSLLYRHWTMTVEGQPPNEVYVGRRPFGWSGPGDPFERITAPTRTQLLRLLAFRHLGVNPKKPGGPMP